MNEGIRNLRILQSKAVANGFLVLIFIAFLIAGASYPQWITWLTRGLDKGEFVLIKPTDLVSKEKILEFQVAKLKFSLTNGSSEYAELRSLQASCGCIVFLDQAGTPIEFPVDIPPDTELPVRVEVKTAGAVGVQHYGVRAALQVGESKIIRHAKIEIEVTAGIRTNPSIIRLDSSSSAGKTERIIIYDNYPEEGVEIDSIKINTPELYNIQIEKVGDREKEVASLLDMTPRYLVDIALSEKGKLVEQDTHSSLVVRPVSEEHPLVEIPIYIDVPTPTVRLVPSTIVINSSTQEGLITRTVSCFTTTKDIELQLATEMNGVNLQLQRTAKPKQWKLILQVNSADVNSLPAEIQICSSDDPIKQLKIPVYVIQQEVGLQP